MKVHFKILIVLAGLISTAFSFSQNSRLEKIDSLLDARETGKATQVLSEIDSARLDASENARFYLLYARLESLKNNADESYHNFLLAKKKYTAMDSLGQAISINLQIIPPSHLEREQRS